LVAVGFKMKIKDLFTKGYKTLLLGGCTWLIVALSTLTFVNVFSGYVNGLSLFAPDSPVWTVFKAGS